MADAETVAGVWLAMAKCWRMARHGSPWRKPLSVAVMMLWIAAAAEVSGPLLISYFIDNMV
ncbi:putative multidrug transporter membrane ATP-binding component, partial [Salmonella enterica subsp. enterica serovar Urbana str. R8-2977]